MAVANSLLLAPWSHDNQQTEAHNKNDQQYVYFYFIWLHTLLFSQDAVRSVEGRNRGAKQPGFELVPYSRNPV